MKTSRIISICSFVTISIIIGLLLDSYFNYADITVVRQDSLPIPDWKPVDSIDITDNITKFPKLQDAIIQSDKAYEKNVEDCKKYDEIYEHSYCGKRFIFQMSESSQIVLTRDEFQIFNKNMMLKDAGYSYGPVGELSIFKFLRYVSSNIHEFFKSIVDNSYTSRDNLSANLKYRNGDCISLPNRTRLESSVSDNYCYYGITIHLR